MLGILGRQPRLSGTATPGAPADLPHAHPAGRRERPLLALLAVIAVLDVVLWVTVLLSTPPAGSTTGAAVTDGSPQATASPTVSASTASGAPPDQPRIELASATYSGTAFETIPISGVLQGAPAGSLLRVQLRQDGRWQPFPLPTTTDAAGRFTAYVELGAPGTYGLRVRDPATERVSPVVTLEIQ